MECCSTTENRSMCFVFMLGLKEAIDQLAMANSVHWYGHVLWSEDGPILRGVLLVIMSWVTGP